MLDLRELVGASRALAMGDGNIDVNSLQLPHVAAHTRALLAAVGQRKQKWPVDAAGVDELDGDPELAAQQEEILLCFRIMRNAAAAGASAAAAVLEAGVVELASAALDLLASAAIPLNWQLPAVLAQVLANLCTASSRAAQAAWTALFPLRLTMLAHVNAGPTQGATCLALLACCRAVDGAAAALAGEQGGQLMTALLCNHQRMAQQGEHNDALGLLAAHLCFRRDLLPRLFASLGPDATLGSSSAAAGGPAALEPTVAQAALLELLGQEAQDVPQAAGGGSAAAEAGAGDGRQGASMAFLGQLAQDLAAASKAVPLSVGQQQVLQGTLHLMRDVCARDDSGHGLSTGGMASGAGLAASSSAGADLVAELQAAGAVHALLAMLKALDPIQNPQQQRQAAAAASGGGQGQGHAVDRHSSGVAGSSGGTGASGGIQVAELAPQLAALAARFPRAQPYQGFRSDLLAALANAAHGRPAVQAEVCQVGGVELVLAQCQLDRESPLAREWGLWAVRNLCEGNPAAQDAIRQLQLCTTVESEELQRLGVKLELDEHSGKLRVTKRDPPAVGATLPDGGNS